jgi:two-component system, NtrC family, sensor histidine kinase PilS
MRSIGFIPLVSFNHLKQRLKWLMLFRASLASLIGLGFVTIQYSSALPPFHSHSTPSIISTLLVAYAINLLYIYALDKVQKTAIILAYLQMSSDVLISAALITLTGGLESPVLFLFTINVLLGALLLERQGAWFVVILTFGAIILLCIQEASQLNFNRLQSANFALKQILTNGLINVAIICFVATLAGYLGQQVRTSDLRVRTLDANLKTLQYLNEHLLMSMQNGMIYLNHTGHILFVNRAVEDIYESQATDFLGKPIQQFIDQIPQDFLHVLTSDSQITLLNELTDSNQYRFQWEQLLISANYTSKTINCSLFSLQHSIYDSSDQDWVLMIQDVTELRQLTQSIQRKEHLASIGEMAAQIAHEIRNPLASMSNSLQLLTPYINADPLSTKLLEIVERETDRLSNLTQEFLNFARPQQVQAQDMSLYSIVQDVSLLVSVDIVHEIDPALTVYADPNHIKQILWNVIRNAIEAQAYHIEIIINKHSVSLHSLPFYNIFVVDNGIGIQDADRQIFEPFYTTKEQGSGLGLAMCRSLIESHAGSIEARQLQPQGTLIAFTLPANKQAMIEGLQRQNRLPFYHDTLIKRWNFKNKVMPKSSVAITLH